MTYLETLLVFRKDRKNIITEVDKQGMVPVMMIQASLVCEYIQVNKVMKSVVSSL